MPGRALVSWSVLFVTAMLLCPATSRSAEIIDISVYGSTPWQPGVKIFALDDEGGTWECNDYTPWFRRPETHTGAVGLDFGVDPVTDEVRGFIAYANGDLLPLQLGVDPSGPIIPGPVGASGIEEISVQFRCLPEPDLIAVIRSGCIMWAYIERDGSGSWSGPLDIGSLPSATEPSTWGKIKAEFSE